ncbi:metallophosphoesterase family protein [Rugosimonospora africana]|uniref:Phosphoesterase n=1 Tax=Rugosimonospora africana TaxID=556532 RepID=A0A8J3VS83_9ACTN|nr:metallophosphoesterase family protein [Rugosimonospora africana]GIH16301.1 phosphoesterase [Rugosimonospora africana]
MRVAVLSDIHGVLPALDAVLAEPDVRSADRIVLTGDLAAGPQPVETLDALTALGDRAVWVRGNADRELVTLHRDGQASVPDPVAPWAAAQLRPDQVDLLDSLPLSAVLDIDGFGPILFCHATPRDDEEVVLVDSRLDRWTEVFATLDASVSTVVCGHTHMSFVRLVDRRLVVNPGSVGMPYGGPGAHWAMLDGDRGVTMRRTRFDVDAACARMSEESAYPKAREFAEYFLRSKASDTDALRVFGPRDGRTT